MFCVSNNRFSNRILVIVIIIIIIIIIIIRLHAAVKHIL